MSSTSHSRAIVESLRTHGETVSVAESLTGGGLGHAITQTPGASDVFCGGVIAYTEDVKRELLGVDPALIAEFSVVSEEVALAMAKGVQEKFGTTGGIGQGVSI